MAPVNDDDCPERDRVTPWRFANGNEFELPGGHGRLERLAFDSGMVLYRCEIEVFDDCVVAVEQALAEPWLGCCLHLAGQSVMETPDGQTREVSPDCSLVVRVDRPGTRFHLPGGQILRHIGVSTTLSALKRRLNDELDEALIPFANPGSDISILQSIETSSRLRALSAELFTARADGPFRLLTLEGISSRILAETLAALCRTQSESASTFARWEREALGDVITWIRAEPGSPLVLSQLATEFGLSEHRLERLCRDELGRSFADLVRGERLCEAQRLLQQGELPIKQVAAQVGYTHVSNFSRAYRARIGETPARTLRRSLKNR